MPLTLCSVTASRLEKAAMDNGFDREQPGGGDWLSFASTQCPLRLWLTAASEGPLVAAFSQNNVAAALGDWGVPWPGPLPPGALAARSATDIPALHHLLRRAYQLSKSIPDELLHLFTARTAKLPRRTEAERLVVERVGQDIFRQGLMEYWEGRCAITGLAVPELLRASHIKPWAACDTDAERLDVYNGFLLAAHLDAAFDSGLITIGEDGLVMVSSLLDESARRALGLEIPARVRSPLAGHFAYLKWHADRVFRGKAL